MATIEERAKAFANERWPKENFKYNDRYRREHYQKSRDTYIAIATEQKAIDIDKACKWLHSTIGDGFVRYGTERMVADNDQFEAMFRKAMEEE